MAATDRYDTAPGPQGREVSARVAGELDERLKEEISRAERHRTPLSCLLVTLDAHTLCTEHDEHMRRQALAYAAAALSRQLRRFDRIGSLSEEELLVLLPGADGPRAEIVARRALRRLEAVKVERDGRRHPIGVAIALANWYPGLGAGELLERARLAAARDLAAGTSVT